MNTIRDQPAPDGREFAAFLDPERMRELLQRRLPQCRDAGVTVTDCRVGHRHYKWYRKPASRAKARLAVCYQLTLASGPVEARQWLYAKFYLDGRSALDVAAGAGRAAVRPPYADALAHWADLDAAVWGFPNDPLLTQLPQLLDTQAVREHLPAVFRGPQRVDDLTVKIINYRPERRCSMAYTLRSGQRVITLFGKTFADDSGRRIYRTVSRLWRLGQSDRRWFFLPQPLGYDADARLFWQDYVSGRPLPLTLQSNDAARSLDCVASALAWFHTAAADGLGAAPAETSELAEIEKKLAKLACAVPHLRQRLTPLWRSFERAARHRQTPLPGRLVHNDFHSQQLLLNGDRVTLFDLDEAAVGDPGRDLATLIVDFHQRLGLAPRRARACSDFFVRRYQRHARIAGGADADTYATPERLSRHLMAVCLTRAYRLVWQLAPQRDEQLQVLLDLAECGATAFSLRAYP